MSVTVPQGFRMSGLHCGLKRNPNNPDLSIIASTSPAVAAGVYTKNLVYAAPVAVDRERTPSESIRALVVNSGNANACTGERGLTDCLEMARLTADAVGCQPEQVLVMSTGLIGEFLSMEKIATGIDKVSKQLDNSEDALNLAARGFMTTDTFHKVAGRELTLGGQQVTLTGIAKGAAMIGPNMATMLGLVLTDACLTSADAQRMLGEITEETFNCISVEGHMSTNDTVLLLANGTAGVEPLAGDDLKQFEAALRDLCEHLARLIPTDGEGAEHLIEVEVHGCADRLSAQQIAKTVANSALVKTAITGADPNWGRIVSAAGYAGVRFDPNGVNLWVNGYQLYQNGAPTSFDAEVVSKSIRENRDTKVELRFAEGDASIKFWTTDLTAEYVRLNADYHT